MRIFFIFLASVLAAMPAEARKFDFGLESFSTYFGGSFGTSKMGDSAYGTSSGSGTTVDKKIPWTTSGDFGVAISLNRVNILLGMELLMPRTVSSIEGKNASGTLLFKLKSNAQAFVPMVNVEVLAYKAPHSRVLFGAGGGYAFASLENTYEMTSAGQSALGIGDHVERGRGTGTLLQAYVAGEFLFTDTVTAVLGGGYRNLIIQSLQAPQNGTAITGAQPSGADLKNMDGGHRTMDMGGAFAMLQFRFYLGK